MPKRVWILGAGASKDMGYPLGYEVMMDIHNKLCEICSKRNVDEYQRDICETCDKQNKLCRSLWIYWDMIRESLRRIYGHDHLNEIDFEDYFSRMSLLNQGYFPVFSDWGHDYANKIRKAFLSVYYWYGYQLCEILKGRKNNYEKNYFIKCLKHIADNNELIVSFNQDILVESSLIGWVAASDTPPIHKEYSCNSEQIDDGNKLSILKLHGSLNWVLLEKDKVDPEKHKGIYAFNNSKLFQKLAVYESKDMETITNKEGMALPSVCLLMLPDIFKGMPFTNDKEQTIENVFKILYNTAVEHLGAAEQVIIVGFAARPTDYLSSMLLNLGLRGKTNQQVVVIDPSENVPKGISNNIKEFTYIRKTFYQWVEEGGLESFNKS